MCGIVGYIGKNKSTPYLIDGLKALEYRGYDSAGVAVCGKKNLQIIKSVGKVAALEVKVKASSPDGFSGIAHTRWATHGKPTELNSHPHTDCSGEIAIVHNGIIENYQSIRERLEKDGHIFRSETDTEVMAHLLEEKLKNVSCDHEKILIKALSEMAAELQGSYAIAIVWQKAPGVIIGTKNKSPLVAGIGKNENFLASDVSAFKTHADKAIYLDDGDIVVLKASGVELYDKEGVIKKYKLSVLEKSGADTGKNGFEHYMLKEIMEQPSTIRSTISSVLDDINSAFGIKTESLKKIKNIMIVGCGTAYHAALTAKYWMEEFTNIPTQAELASEYKYRKAAMPKETLAIFVSQSGETADTVAALEKAKASGFKTVAICNVYGSTLSRICDNTFYTKCGQEISVASTKAFTAQLAALFALSVLIGKATGFLNETKTGELLGELSRIPEAVEFALKSEPAVRELAERYYRDKSFVFLGRNVNYPIALEGALKLKEITYLQAEGFAAGEIKHGPIALLNVGTPVIALAPGDALFDKMTNACEEVMARGAEAVAITDNTGMKALDIKIKNKIVLPDTPEYLVPMINVIALQLFAYWIARLNGREIDLPRNLAKSVTVE